MLTPFQYAFGFERQWQKRETQRRQKNEKRTTCQNRQQNEENTPSIFQCQKLINL